MHRRRTALGALVPAVFVANAVVVVALWLHAGGVMQVHGTADVLLSAGRLAGLLGAYLVLLQVLLLARLGPLERALGPDRIIVWHARNGRAAICLLVTHAVLIVAGNAVSDGIGPRAELARLIRAYPGVITAIAGLAALIAVAVTSAIAVRRRLRYETWHFVHLYAYLGIALAFSHQIATGSDFVGDRAARTYWTALYLTALAAVVAFRLALPLVRAARHRLRVERLVEEAPGVVSVEIGGRRLADLHARPGQFFCWRFLTRSTWWESHPYSLSAAPDGRRLRITVKGLGDHSRAVRTLAPGTRVLAEGPFGAFTADARRRARVALIAGGIGITPIRAMLEEMPGAPGDIAVVYRALHEDDVVLRRELDDLAGRRGAEMHYVIGDHRGEVGAALLSPAHLRELVPDIALRDVYVCGSPAMTEATRVSLRGAGVPGRHIVLERFAL